MKESFTYLCPLLFLCFHSFFPLFLPGLEFDGAASSNYKLSSLSPFTATETLPSLHLLCTHSLHHNLIPLVLSFLPQEEGILYPPHAPKELEQSHHHHHSPFFGKFLEHHLFIYLASTLFSKCFFFLSFLNFRFSLWSLNYLVDK